MSAILRNGVVRGILAVTVALAVLNLFTRVILN